jgi:hypothetical protein
MPGTLVITTLSDGTNSTSATNPIQGSAKAWVRFVGSTGVIASSYNVSSVTRNSTGFYTVNFTTALANTNYSAVANSSYSNVPIGTSTFYNIASQVVVAPTTSALAVSCNNGAGLTPIDPAHCSVSVFTS